MLNKLLKKMKEYEDFSSINKKSMEHVIKSMKPEMGKDEDEDEMEDKKKQGMGPEAKIEIELMLSSAKKKKSK